MRPESASFIPTGVNVLTVNLTHRNWTALGPGGHALEGHGGSLRDAHAQGLRAVLDALRGPGGADLDPRPCSSAAQVEQRLRDGWQNRVVTRYRVHDALDWSSEAMAFRHGGGDWVRWTHTLAWHRGRAGGAWPSPWACAPTTPCPWARCSAAGCGTGSGASTARPPCSCRSRPGYRLVRQGPGGPAPGPAAARSPPGAAGPAAAGWRVWPAGTCGWSRASTWTLETFALIPAHDRRLRWQSLEAEGLAASAGPGGRRLGDARRPPLGLALADPDLLTLVTALAHRLPVFDNGSHFAPGAFFYNHHWIRDSAFLALAHDLWGLHGAVAAKEAAWMRTRTRGGDFRSHSGEWDGTGQTLFFWATHALVTGSPGVLARHWRRHGPGRPLDRPGPAPGTESGLRRASACCRPAFRPSTSAPTTITSGTTSGAWRAWTGFRWPWPAGTAAPAGRAPPGGLAGPRGGRPTGRICATHIARLTGAPWRPAALVALPPPRCRLHRHPGGAEPPGPGPRPGNRPLGPGQRGVPAGPLGARRPLLPAHHPHRRQRLPDRPAGPGPAVPGRRALAGAAGGHPGPRQRHLDLARGHPSPHRRRLHGRRRPRLGLRRRAVPGAPGPGPGAGRAHPAAAQRPGSLVGDRPPGPDRGADPRRPDHLQPGPGRRRQPPPDLGAPAHGLPGALAADAGAPGGLADRGWPRSRRDALGHAGGLAAGGRADDAPAEPPAGG